MKADQENVLLSALGQRWKSYQTGLRNCRREFSAEAVHDLRIAARRLLAVLDMIRALDPQPDVQKMRRVVKDQLDDFDELRDVQVMLAELAEDVPLLPQLERFQPYLAKREKRLLRIAREDIGHFRLSDLRERVDNIRGSIEPTTRKKTFDRLLLLAVDQAYLRAAYLYTQIDRAKPGTIHQARIAFKKFRYMAEIVGPLLPEPPDDYFKCMHDYQSAMGDIRDVTVFLDALHEFAGEHTVDFELKPIRRYFAKRLDVLISVFMADKDELHTFWRSTPESPFPWETSHDPVHNPARHRRSSRQRRGGRRQPAAPDTKRPAEDAAN